MLKSFRMLGWVGRVGEWVYFFGTWACQFVVSISALKVQFKLSGICSVLTKTLPLLSTITCRLKCSVRSFHKQIVNGPLTMKHGARNCKLPGPVLHKVLLGMTVSRNRANNHENQKLNHVAWKVFFPFTACHKTVLKETQFK